MRINWSPDHRPEATAAVMNAAADALQDFAEAMLTDANQRVPIETAALERSGNTDHDRDNLRSSVYYDTPYAIEQHENTQLSHDAGREAKWLENTIKTRGKDLAPFVRDRIRRVL